VPGSYAPPPGTARYCLDVRTASHQATGRGSAPPSFSGARWLEGDLVL